MPTHPTKRELLWTASLLLTLGLSLAGGADPLPPTWTAQDLRRPTMPGSVDVDSRGLWVLRAASAAATPKADGDFFVAQPLAGDGSVVAHLLGLTDGNGASGLGVSIRENATPGARHVFTGMLANGSPFIRYRTASRKNGTMATWDRRFGPRQLPVWMRWQREGDQFTPFASADGFGWTQLHSPITLPRFPSPALAGIAAVSGTQGPMMALLDSPTVVPGQVSPLVQRCVGSRAVLLTWAPVQNAVGYVVRRSDPAMSAVGADTLTPVPIRETSFTDTALISGRTVRYLVSAVFDAGGQAVESWSTAVIATPVATPADLFGCDINLEMPPLQGGIAFDPTTQTYRISGAGGEAPATTDQVFFASRLVSGDFDITVRVLDRPANQAGLMVREALDGPARMFFLAATSSRGVLSRYRDRMGVAARTAATVVKPKSFQPPLWVRLSRRGDRITAFTSPDGATFKQAGRPVTYRPPLPGSLYVGYAIAGTRPEALASNSFSDLTISP